MIDYYLQPFAAPEEKNVLAAIANQINREGTNDPIAQAPQDYEVWQLGLVTEEGTLVPERRIVTNCAQLVRRSLRENGKGDTGATEAPEDEINRYRVTGRHPESAGASKPPPAPATQSQGSPAAPAPGGYRGMSDDVRN